MTDSKGCSLGHQDQQDDGGSRTGEEDQEMDANVPGGIRASDQVAGEEGAREAQWYCKWEAGVLEEGVFLHVDKRGTS